jgi:hypothetical protein
MLIKDNSSHSHLFSFIIRSYRALFRRGLRRRLICLFLMMNFLVWPGAGLALRELPVLASTAFEATTESLGFIPKLFNWMFGPAPQRQQSLADRIASVSTISLSPRRFVGYLGETTTFTALGTDSSGEVVHGAKYTWESSDTEKLQIDEAGRASFLLPGLLRVTCHAGSASATAHVLVRPQSRPVQTDAEWRADQDSLTDDGRTVGESVLPSLLDRLAPTAHAQGGGYGNDVPSDGLVGQVGTPPHTMLEPTRLGPVMPKTNFEFAVPVANLGGRGLAASLNLYYNSNLWTARLDQSTNELVWIFDPIQSWPGPGFSLGFGRIVYYDGFVDGSLVEWYKYMLIDPI